jgi:hypothetical protein
MFAGSWGIRGSVGIDRSLRLTVQRRADRRGDAEEHERGCRVTRSARGTGHIEAVRRLCELPEDARWVVNVSVHLRDTVIILLIVVTVGALTGPELILPAVRL